MDASRLSKLERIFPYDGPHDADSVTEASQVVAHLMRYLNIAIRGQTTLPYAATVDDVVGSLADGAYRVDQLLRQVATALTAHRDHGQLYDDQAPDMSTSTATARETATVAIDLLNLGRSTATELADVLQKAHNATARLGHHDA